MSRNNFSRSAGLAALLFTAISALPALRAQPAEPTVHGRYLFIFDTSLNMKKRVPAVQKTLTSMLATGLGGQLHTGDTPGVWTFNQDLRPGDFPLQVWDPEDAASIASNMTQFIGGQKYATATRFEALQPLLNRVVKSSERLTIIIFCDGATKITGTTFDTGINQLFEQNAAVQKKARQPFVVLLRSQLGKYVGCTVSYPPQLVSFPQFPPLPEPPPAPRPVPVPLPAPAVVTPSLFITGTNIENRLASPVAKPAPTNPPPVIEPAPATVAPTSTPVVVLPAAPVVQPVPPPAALPVAPVAVAPAVPVVPTNPPAAPPVNPPALVAAPVVIPPANPIVPGNAPANVPATIPVAPANAQTPVLTNNPVVAAENQAASGKKTLLIVAVCLLAAGVLTALAAFFFRRPDRRSLISRSMHDK